jgi:hypothetical protein
MVTRHWRLRYGSAADGLRPACLKLAASPAVHIVKPANSAPFFLTALGSLPMLAGPRLRARGLTGSCTAGPASSWAERSRRRLAGYLRGNREPGRFGARLTVGAFAVYR